MPGRQHARAAPVGDRLDSVHAVFPQQADHAVAAAGAAARDQDPAIALLQPVDVLAHGLEQRPAPLRPLGHEIPAVAGARVRAALRLDEGRALRDRAACEQPRPFLRIEKEGFWRNRMIGRVRDRGGSRVRARIVEVRNGLEAVVTRFRRAMVEQHRAVRHVVEERLQPVVEERQPMLDAGVAPRGGDRLVERVLPGHGPELPAVGRAEAGDRLRVEQHLADRREVHGIGGLGAPLRDGIEPAHGLDRVAEEVEPHRALGIGRENIHDAAAHGIVARVHHRAGAHEAVALQVAEQGLGIERRAGRERERRVGEHRAGRHPLERCIDGGEHHPGPCRAVAQQADEAGEPPARDVGAGRDPVVRQAVPGRDGDLDAAGIEEGEHRGETREPRVVAGDVERGCFVRLCQPEQQRRRKTLGNAADGGGLSRRAERAHAAVGDEDVHGRGSRRRECRFRASRLRRVMNGVSCSSGTGVRPLIQFVMSTSFALSSRSACATSSGGSAWPSLAMTSPTRRSVSFVPVRAER